MADSQEITTSRSANENVNTLTSDIAGGASDIIDRGPAVFDRTLYGGQGALTRQGIGAFSNAANMPGYGGAVRGAMDYTGNLAGGGGLGAGPTRGFSPTVGAGDRGFSGVIAPGAQRGYETLRQGAIDDAQMAGNRSFASDGTYGSGKHREALGRGIGRAVAGIDYQNYRDDIGLRERDFSRQEGMFQSDRGLSERNVGRQEGVFQSDLNQRQLDFGQQERAAAALPGIFQAGLMPAQAQLAAGQMQDADTQAQLLARQDLFRRTNDAELNLLGRGANILGTTAGAGGTTTTEPGTPWWQSGIGYGLGLAGSALSGGMFGQGLEYEPVN